MSLAADLRILSQEQQDTLSEDARKEGQWDEKGSQNEPASIQICTAEL